MLWTVFDVMRMRDYKFWLKILFFILQRRILLFYFAVLQHIVLTLIR